MIGHSRVYPSLLREEKDQAQKSSEVNKLYRKKKGKQEEGYPKEKKDIQGTPILPEANSSCHKVWRKKFFICIYIIIYIYTTLYFRWIKINKP